jgi:hypothetical protein
MFGREQESASYVSGDFVECSDCETVSGPRVAATYELQRCASPHTLDNNDGALVCNPHT